MAAGADKHSKTEKPTPKRRKEARERGQVPHSPDVSSAAALLVASMIVPMVFHQGETVVLGATAQMVNVASHPSVPNMLSAAEISLKGAFVVVLLVSSIFAALGAVVHVAQTGPVFSLKAAKPKFSRINPKDGVKRLVSPTAAVGLGRQSLKLLAIGGLAEQTLVHLMHTLPTEIPVPLGTSLGLGASSILGFVRTTALISLAIGLGDFFWNRHKIMQGLRMTKQEVKDEAKSAEGDPHMKGEIRKRGYAIARSRTLAAVRTADVVIANPTHFCVALQYQPGSKSAPRVVAKGSDHLAKRMREEAGVHAIPLVEDPPLARYLYATTEIGHTIPAEIYVAVAKLLAFVYSLPDRVRGVGVHHRPPSVVPYDPLADLAGAPRRRPSSARLRRAPVLSGSAP